MLDRFLTDSYITHRFIYAKTRSLLFHDYAPNFEKVGEHIGFGLCVRSFVRPFVRSKKIQARVLKFHILIPRQK